MSSKLNHRQTSLATKEYQVLLEAEMIQALGCTEPIAIALCCAKARDILGDTPTEVDLHCSANIIKNTHSVIVPNSGGLKGIPTAAALGIVGGDSELGLQVLSSVGEKEIIKARAMIQAGVIRVFHATEVDNLYIRCAMKNGVTSSSAVISGTHTNFSLLTKDDKVIHRDQARRDSEKQDLSAIKARMKVEDIHRFATLSDLSEMPEILTLIRREIESNYAIAQEGIRGAWGQKVGRTLLKTNPEDWKTEMVALAAAGSDARMNGCPLPVVINSGSGNQGMTLSIPLIHMAITLELSEEKLIRALILANLVGLHQKQFIGSLSAYCGAVSAAAAAAAGIAYLEDQDYDVIARSIINTLAVSSGIICDGAKSSCAGKIAVALRNAQLAVEMAKQGEVFEAHEGILGKDIEETIRNVGNLARKGMQGTDVEILNIMLKQ